MRVDMIGSVASGARGIRQEFVGAREAVRDLCVTHTLCGTTKGLMRPVAAPCGPMIRHYGFLAARYSYTGRYLFVFPSL